LSISTLQHLRIHEPFLPLLPKRLVSFALPPRSSAHRVWLPFRRLWLHEPLKAFFSLQRSWASLYKAFSPSDDRIQVSLDPSAPALSYQTCEGLIPALRRLSPIAQLSTFTPPEGLVRVSTLSSLELLTSWALPPASDNSKLLSSNLPSRSFNLTTLRS
jgi:hypothetical protein